jgi:predicted RNA polymerase sigma factor
MLTDMASDRVLTKEGAGQVQSFCDYLIDYVHAIRAEARDGDWDQVVELYQVAYETLDNLGTFLGLSDGDGTAGDR